MDATDAQLWQAAFDHVNQLVFMRGGILDAEDLGSGFHFQGERIALINPQRGIFKPRQMAYLLSIRTVFPRKGGRIWYDDQREIHRQIYASNEVIEYAFMGTDPNSPDNRWLREAMEQQVPVIYFLGTSPGRYQPIIPTFIVGWCPERLRVQLAFDTISGASAQAVLPASPERRYSLREIKARLHQASFREAVLAAYGGQCAISRLPEPRLLDAAHIVMDADEQYGQPVIPNGLPLTKIHHAAFDANLIGIDPDYRVHVSERLLEIHDGPFLELGLKGIAGMRIEFPKRAQDWPDRDRLAIRFEQLSKPRSVIWRAPMVMLYVGITDYDWFRFLSGLSALDEVNFWQPGGRTNFQALQPGELFLFKLHSPRNFIVGGGVFARAEILPTSLTWDAFGTSNGAPSLAEMRSRIAFYRGVQDDPRQDYAIGCRILTQPFFFREDEWIPVPPSWSRHIQQGRTYDTAEGDRRLLWEVVTGRLSSRAQATLASPRYGEPTLIWPRLGQGAFRVSIIGAYHRRCAVTCEKTLPILDAAHIRPYEEGGEHDVRNGLLLCTDIHRLLDTGYVTINSDGRFEVGQRLKG